MGSSRSANQFRSVWNVELLSVSAEESVVSEVLTVPDHQVYTGQVGIRPDMSSNALEALWTNGTQQ